MKFLLILAYFLLANCSIASYLPLSFIATKKNLAHSIPTHKPSVIPTLPLQGSSAAMTSEQEDDTNSLIHSTDLEAVRNQVALDGKRIGSFTTSSSLVTALVGVPVWLTVVLPLSVVYQTAKKSIGIFGFGGARREFGG